MANQTDSQVTVKDVIDTEGVPIEAIPAADVPAYSIAKAIEWAQRPENARHIEAFAERAKEAQNATLERIDDGITRVKRLMVKVLTDEDEKDAFVNSFLESIMGDD